MNIQAILFDLYDTLVRIDPDEYIKTKAAMAETVQVSASEFLQAWKRYTKPAAIGAVYSLEERLKKILDELNATYTPDQLNQLIALETNLQHKKITPLPGCQTVLRHISEKMGLKIALVTNTPSISEPVLDILCIRQWFNVVVFSFQCGLLKPDPTIYQLAASKLGVTPESCIFVGDGNDLELNGAKDVGMVAVKINTSRDARLSSKQSTKFDYAIDKLEELIPFVLNRHTISGK